MGEAAKPRHKAKSAKPAKARPAGHHLVEWIGEALFFAALCLALRWWVHPELHYFNGGAALFALAPSWSSNLAGPGGLLDGLLNAGLHGCQAPWLGAALGAALVWTACQAWRFLLQQAHGTPVRATHWLLGPPLIAVLGQYERGAGVLALGLALALMLGAGAVWLARRGGLWRWLAPWLSVALLYMAGGLPPVLFLVMTLLVGRWEPARPPAVGEALNLAAAAAAVLATNIFWAGVPLARALVAWETPVLQMAAAALAGWLLVVSRVRARFYASPPESAGPPPVKKPSAPSGAHPARQRALWAAGMAAGVAAALAMCEPARRQVLLLHYLGAEQRWPEFLALARQQHQLTPAAHTHLLRALHFTGQLPEDLFAYPVFRDDELLPGVRHGPEACAALSQAMLELGQVNHAERLASEAVEILGERPDLLWVLARVCVLKNCPVAAGNYLRVLRQQPFHRHRADALLSRLKTDPRLDGDPEIAALRRLMVTTDYTSPGNPTASLMLQLLHTNPTNRMAFEFLLSHYLVAGQLEKFMEHLGRLPAMGYSNQPRHYEEAAILAAHLKRLPPRTSPALVAGEATLQRHIQFDRHVRANITDLSAARPVLAREFGDTYWFFFLYGQSAATLPAAAATP